MRLIDADTVVTIQVYDDMTEETETKKMTIAEAIDKWSDEGCPPTVDAEPIRHGHWIHWIFNPKDAIEMIFTLPKCSECGAESPNGGNYCPHCGAKMDGERRKDETN